MLQKLNWPYSNPSLKNWILNLKLNGNKFFQTNSVKYLRIKIDRQLNWRDHINEVAIKLNRANAMLYKIRIFIN